MRWNCIILLLLLKGQTERMRLKTDGKVGIGTDNPASGVYSNGSVHFERETIA